MSENKNAVAVKERGDVEFTPFGAADKLKLNVRIVQTLLCEPTKQGRICSERDAMKFIAMCQAKRLNPFEGDAFLIGYDQGDSAKFSLITAHQAFLKRAELHPEFDGLRSGLVVRDKQTKVISDTVSDFYLRDEQDLLAGWAIVYFKSRRVPMEKRVLLSTFNKDFAQWKTNPHGMICKCFDEQTEVLTTRGFERFATAEGRVLQVTDNGLEPTDAIPFFQPYNGDMVCYDSRNGNFIVTPNHDLPIFLNGMPERKMEAGNLLTLRQRDKAVMPLTITQTRPEHSIDDLTIKLAAIYIADGSDNSASSGFCVAVSRNDKIETISELGMHLSKSIKRDAGRESVLPNGRVIVTKSDKVAFYFSRTASFTWLVGRKKTINHESILSLSMRQARLLIDTWIDFDGSKPESLRVGRISTSRPEHVKALELLAVIAGYSIGKASSRSSDGCCDNFAMVITNRTVVRLSRTLLKTVKNSGAGVWCVTVPTSRIVVKRNGFSSVCHQCAEADALRSSFPTMNGGLYLREELDIPDQRMIPSKPNFAPSTTVSFPEPPLTDAEKTPKSGFTRHEDPKSDFPKSPVGSGPSSPEPSDQEFEGPTDGDPFADDGNIGKPEMKYLSMPIPLGKKIGQEFRVLSEIDRNWFIQSWSPNLKVKLQAEIRAALDEAGAALGLAVPPRVNVDIPS